MELHERLSTTGAPGVSLDGGRDPFAELKNRIHLSLVSAWSPTDLYTIAASYGDDFQQGDVRGGIYAGKQVLRNVFLVRVTVAPRLSRSFLPPDEEARAKGVIR